MTNPLLNLRFPIPFDEIRPEHVAPAVSELLDRAQTEVDRIAATAEATTAPTYGGTLGALERATEPLELAMTVVGHLENTSTTDELRAAYSEAKPKVSAFSSSIPTNAGLWAALKRFAETEEAQGLDPTRARFLSKTLDDFRRAGADLAEEDKRTLLEIDVELSRLTTQFAQNVLDATNAWELVIEERERLAGLPASAIEAAREDAARKGVEGWRFTLQAPSLVAVLTHMDDAQLRRRMWCAYTTRALTGEYGNGEHLARILELRARKAKLLGFGNFADLVLEDRMAKTGAKARAFLEDLRERSRAAAERDHEELSAFRRSIEGEDAPALEAWDLAYYAEKQRKALYDFDEEALRPYFPAPRVLEGMFEIVNRLYGVRVERAELPVWHESVESYRMFDAEGELVAMFYVDIYPRETKRGGAWMNPLHSSTPADHGEVPHVGLFCANSNPPVGGKPALLSHSDVETLFHEFGHLMHHCASRVSVRSLAGSNVAWDFVELPSQIMENWCWERGSLDLFAGHWESGDPIPEELFQRMKNARTYRAASGLVRQLGYGIVDLALHCDYVPERDGDAVDYAREVMRDFNFTPLPDDYAAITSFSHLFSSPVGYASGYYSYLWAEVLDADAFSRFAEEGLFDPEAGAAFFELLASGDSRDPMDLYVAFRGREPELDALLERKGLATAAAT